MDDAHGRSGPIHSLPLEVGYNHWGSLSMPHWPAAADFIPLTSQEQIATVIAKSASRPVLIFKHSPSCGTSAEAYEELATVTERIPVYLVDVLDDRPISNAIAAHFGVRHESPQALLLSDGQARWIGSHYHVTADEVLAALAHLS